jgi:nucleotide-binding universal stress UspA family protein
MVVDLVVLESGAEIDLVHVQPWLNMEAAETELPRCGWAATAQARQLLDAASVCWHLHVVMGEGAPEIVAKADALGSRGIAIGSRGLTVTESLLLGSVAYDVAHMAKLPVLIVR